MECRRADAEDEVNRLFPGTLEFRAAISRFPPPRPSDFRGTGSVGAAHGTASGKDAETGFAGGAENGTGLETELEGEQDENFGSFLRI